MGWALNRIMCKYYRQGLWRYQNQIIRTVLWYYADNHLHYQYSLLTTTWFMAIKATLVLSEGDLVVSTWFPSQRDSDALLYSRSHNFLTHSDCIVQLTHWGRDKMDAISQTRFSNVFSRRFIFEYRLKFYWILFPRGQLTISKHWFR